MLQSKILWNWKQHQHLEKFVTKQHSIDNCELYLTMLDTELAYNPWIKFVTLDVNYNFYLGHTAMQTL